LTFSPSKGKRASGSRGAAPASLGEYSAKRTFAATPEPAPAVDEATTGDSDKDTLALDPRP